MTDAMWRRLLIGLTMFAFVQFGVVMFTQSALFANLPDYAVNLADVKSTVSLDDTPTPGLYRVSVDKSDSWYARGVRTGDLLDLRVASDAVRYRMSTQVFYPGETVTLTFQRGAVTTPLAFTAEHHHLTWDAWVFANVGLLWMLVFAAIIVWKRASVPEARALALFLLLYNIGLNFQSQSWVTPWPMLDAWLAVIAGIPTYAAFAMTSVYASTFARPLSGVRRAANALTYAMCAVAIVAYVMANFIKPVLFVPFPQGWLSVPPSLFCAVALLPLVFGIMASKGSERARLVWAGLPLATIYLPYVLDIFAPIASPAFLRFLEIFANVSLLIAPVGLTYSLLKRRLLDIGFVFNRVTVYTAVSIIIIGLFVVIEYLVSEVLGTDKQENLIVGAGVALVLGLSMRFIHYRVDLILDKIFFHKRHQEEEAIRNFAHEVVYITDLSTVMERTESMLEQNAHASSVQTLLDDGNGTYGGVTENDEAIVTMRAYQKPVDLSSVRTALRGEHAFPMVSRGRVIGILVLGPKDDGETYAPDEFDAIRQLANGVGNAVDALAAKAEDQSQMVLRAILASLESISSRLPS